MPIRQHFSQNLSTEWLGGWVALFKNHYRLRAQEQSHNKTYPKDRLLLVVLVANPKAFDLIDQMVL
jgi:hypothetical protein